ncbi:MAG: hypothetical protein KKD44_27440, partial [Proteobacteria bacterium]|nr:hypothetical protein [Pseudomonadota bacterium]
MNKVVLFALIFLVLVQAISLLISQVFKSVPILKLGPGFFLFLIAALIYTIFALASRRFDLGQYGKNDFLVILLVFAAVVVGLIYLPKVQGLENMFAILKPAIEELKAIIPLG